MGKTWKTWTSMSPEDPEHLANSNNIIHQVNEAFVIGKDQDPAHICCPYIRYGKMFWTGRDRLGKEQTSVKWIKVRLQLSPETTLCEQNWAVSLGKIEETYPCYSPSDTFPVICPHS